MMKEKQRVVVRMMTKTMMAWGLMADARALPCVVDQRLMVPLLEQKMVKEKQRVVMRMTTMKTMIVFLEVADHCCLCSAPAEAATMDLGFDFFFGAILNHWLIVAWLSAWARFLLGGICGSAEGQSYKYSWYNCNEHYLLNYMGP
jgi:hypothetical protein